MKRGLKAYTGIETLLIRYISSNLCPDEKGTESRCLGRVERGMAVATYAPMKRGLKGFWKLPNALMLE